MASSIDYLAQLDDQRFLTIYEALTERGFGPLDGEVAKALKFRPQAIRKLPLAQRAKKARSLVLASKNAELAYEVLGSYLIHDRKDLVTDFLDAVGIEHEDGMVDGAADAPTSEKVDEAVAALAAKHEDADVTMYLALSAQTWPEVERFDELWRQRVGAS